VRDGSIKSQHARLLAELFAILTNFWMIPTIYPSTEDETWERFLFIKEITDKMGLPVYDDAFIELCKQNALR
jgi:hypothetical protein